MIGNIIILGVAVAIIIFVVRTFTTDKKNKLFYRVTAGLFTLLLVFTIFTPNIDWIKSPFTQSTKRKIIDAETKLPLPEVKVIISTAIAWVYFPGGETKNFNFELQETDRNGFFRLLAVSRG